MLSFGARGGKKGGGGRSGTNTSEESILKDEGGREGIRKTMETVVDFEQRSMRSARQGDGGKWESGRNSKVM
jgi:hypothetical protein